MLDAIGLEPGKDLPVCMYRMYVCVSMLCCTYACTMCYAVYVCLFTMCYAAYVCIVLEYVCILNMYVYHTLYYTVYS